MPVGKTSTTPDARRWWRRCGVCAPHTLGLAAVIVASLPSTSAGQRTVAAPDTVFGLGPKLSLEMIIARTLLYSPVVAGAAGTLRNAAAARRVALGAYLPTILLNGITGKTDQSGSTTSSTTDSGSSTSSVQTTYGAGATALLDLYTGGRRGAQISQANAMSEAAIAGLVLQRYATVFTATQGYLDVLRAHELSRVADGQLAQARLGLDYALRRQVAGTAMLADVLSAQLAVSTARQAQLAAADTLIMTTAALGRLVGANGPVDAEPSATLQPTPLAFDDTTVVALAVTMSPQVLTTQAQASADVAGVRVARSLYVPTISALAGYNVGNRSSFVGALRPGWIVELLTTFWLYDGFLREQTITQAEVASSVATATALDTRRLVRAGAVQLLGNLHVGEHNIVLAGESVNFATENLRVFRLRYNAGIATILDVLTAQTSLVQAQLSLVSARFSYLSTRAALEALLGRRL